MNWSTSLSRLEIALQATHGATSEWKNPVPYSISLASLGEARAAVQNAGEQLRREFAFWRDQLSLGFDMRPLPGLDSILRQNGAARFAFPTVLEAEDIARAETACLDPIQQAEKLIDRLAAQHETDQRLVNEARVLLRRGKKQQADEMLKPASRFFQDIPYYQIDLATTPWSESFETARVGLEKKRGAIDVEIDRLQHAFYVPGKSWKAARAAVEAMVIEAGEARTKAGENTDPSLREDWLLYAELLKRWHDHQTAALEAIARKHKTRERLVQHVAVTAAALAFWGLTSICLYETGYRFVDPYGGKHEQRFRWPGEKTIQWIDPNPKYEPLEKTVNITLFHIKDAGTIKFSEMTPTRRYLEIGSRPSNCTIELRNAAGGIIVQGGGPIRGAYLPLGSYSVRLTCGTITHTFPLEVTSDTPMYVSEPLKAANLTIETTPPGVLVYENGKSLGPTPKLLIGLVPGRHQFELKLGGSSALRTIDLADGEDKQSYFGPLKITSNPPGAQIQFKSSDLHDGTTPFNFPLAPAREYQFEVSYPGLDSKRGTITVEPNKTADAAVKFDYASLSINSTPPGATVSFSNANLPDGKTPYPQRVVKPGAYTARITLGSAVESRPLTLKAGDRVKLEIPFKTPPAPPPAKPPATPPPTSPPAPPAK